MLSSFIFFLFLSCQSLNIHSRRILHQPFLPFGSSPPPPPSSTSKYPFSSTTPPPGDTPFFPTFPASPPPPSPSAFASFPVNISSLNLPHAPSPNHTSHTLLILAIIAIVSASIVAVLLIFFYCRRQNLLDDNRTLTSNNSSRLYPNNNVHHARKFRTTTSISTNSSELLYLGTLLNGIDDAAAVSNNSSTHSRFDPRKMDSPELQPLPPLSRETIARNFVESVTEEEEEDFYSPRGSSGGRDSPNGNGSESRRVFATLAAKIIDSNSSSTSSCSSSSSTSNSPARSNSLSVSPPVKSPALEQIQVHSCLSPVRISADPQRLSPVRISADSQRLPNVSNGNVPSPSLSFTWTSPEREEPDHHHHRTREEPDHHHHRTREEPDHHHRTTEEPDHHHHRTTEEPDHHHHRTVQSPSLSPMLVQNPVVLNPNIGSPSLSSPTSSTPPTTPNRALIEKLDASIRNFKDLVRNMGSPLISASTFNASPSKQSPINDLDRKGTSPPSLSSPINDLDRKGTRSPSLSSPASASPERALNENERSPLLSPASSSSSDGPFEKTADESPLLVAFWDYNRSSSFSSSASSSLGRVSGNSPDASPVRLSIALEKPMLTPPPPPPPPPPPKQSRIWEKPLSSISFAKQLSRPPPLMPPSMPFMTHNPISISQVQLPTRSECEVVEEEETEEASKPKLKPLHWDKVRASSDREMVWDHLRSSSFKLNEEMIETLFVANTPNSKPKQATPCSVLPSPNQDNRVLDPKKAQNIAISLRALNVTVEEVCEALLEGNADTLGTELLESLLKMAPTKEEERKLKDYKDGSPIKLGPAEKFLKTVLDIPFAFKRVDAMLYIANFESEVEYLKKSFETLETACEELRTSRMFLKLLEAVLKTGNRMNVGTNRGDAHAFKLDTLLKLVDIKGADGKTTLLHFVVQEIIRIEGTRLSNSNQTQNSSLNEDARCRKLGLQVVSGLSSELTNVKKAASMDSEVLHSDVLKLSRGIENIREVLRLNETTTGSDDSKDKFSESMKRFMKMAEEDIIRIQAVESVALSLVKEITEYFHGNSTKEEAHPFRIFMVVRDFFTVLERVCKEVGMINERTIVSSAHKFPVPVNPMMQPMLPVPVNPMMSQAFPGFQGRLQYGSGSDDETA